jgi:hypothetical protein
MRTMLFLARLVLDTASVIISWSLRGVSRAWAAKAIVRKVMAKMSYILSLLGWEEYVGKSSVRVKKRQRRFLR